MCNIVKFVPRTGAVVTPVKMPLAFRFGAMAHELGFAFLSNPFPPGTIRHTEWADGWTADAMGGDGHAP